MVKRKINLRRGNSSSTDNKDALLRDTIDASDRSMQEAMTSTTELFISGAASAPVFALTKSDAESQQVLRIRFCFYCRFRDANCQPVPGLSSLYKFTETHLRSETC